MSGAETTIALRDNYPASVIPLDRLVASDDQPDYLGGEDIGQHANVGVALCDAHVAEGRGDDVAAIHAESGRTYTYRELADLSTTLAAGLVRAGVHVGDRVAFRGPNSPETLITVLAAWKAGAVVVPTPAQARAGELEYLLSDTGARVLFTSAQDPDPAAVTAAAEASAVEQVIAYGPESGTSSRYRWWRELCTCDAAVPLLQVPSDLPALIWHTGGTTGQPKACYHTHRRYIAGGRATGKALGIEPGDRWGAAAPVGHALGFLVHTSFSLLNGAAAVFIEHFRDADIVLRAISDYRIDTFAAIAATWARLLEAAEASPQHDTGSIRRAYALWQSASTSELAEGWKHRGVKLRNNFGSTAFAAWIIVAREYHDCPAVSLGVPTPGYEIGLVDENGQIETPAGPGVGQLAVKGPTGLTYWGKRDLQRREIRDGWTVVNDLIEFEDDGFISYRGRTDFLISTAGYKVAPVEVEEVLATHPAVSEVGVVGAPDPDRGEVVVAFVAVSPGFTAGDRLRRELQTYVKERLAPYKYPRRVEFIDALPRDHVGKVLPRELKRHAENLDPPDG